MAYNAKTDWKYDDNITENDVNRWEQGIADAHEKADQAEQNAKAHADQAAQAAEQNAKQYTDQQVADIEVPVTSVNNKTGDVTVTKQDVGLSNVDNVKQASKAEHNQLAADFTAHQAEIATETELGHVRVDGETITVDEDGTISTEEMSAENVTLDSENFDSNNVKGALNELFTSVSDGKVLVAGAITDKGVQTSPSATFQQMAENIQDIPVGDYSIGDILEPSQFELLEPLQAWSFTEHTNSVYAVSVDDEGYVYSGSSDRTVRKISPSGPEVWSFTGHTQFVNDVAVGSDGYVYSGSSDNTVRKISQDGSEVWSFTGHTNTVYAVAVGSDGYVYSGSYDNTLRKISPSGSEVWSFTGHTDSVYAVAVDDEGYVYSGSSDNTLRKISPSGSEVWSFTGHTNIVWTVAVDDKGYVYSGSSDDTVRKIITKIDVEVKIIA